MASVEVGGQNTLLYEGETRDRLHGRLEAHIWSARPIMILQNMVESMSSVLKTIKRLLGFKLHDLDLHA